MEIRHSINRRFLLFSLIAQEFIAITFALYSFNQGEIQLAIFYMSVAVTLSVALGIVTIYQQYNVARLLLAATLLTGFFYLLIGASDETSLMWCLTIVPALVGSFGHRQSLLLLTVVFAASIWILVSGAVPFITVQYEDIMVIRFLSSYAILATFSVAMDNSLITSLENYRRLSSKVQEIAHRDVLTNLPNRHNMEERLKLKAHEYQLSKSNFSVVLADLDNFKLLNDRYGRDAGDRILKETAKLMSRQLRDADTIARWAGKQFILLLPDTSDQEAAKIAERLRLVFSDLNLQVEGDPLVITVSMGVTSVEKCIDLDDLISCVENGVYQAKHMGRNRVVIC